MSVGMQHKALLTGVLGPSVGLSSCAVGSRHGVEEGPDGMKHSMMDIMMCDPCCGALLQLLRSGKPASEPGVYAPLIRSEVEAATMSHASDHPVNERHD